MQASTPHDVFISHSSKDKPTADAICALLERSGLRCWMAPRDVHPGEDWAGAIIRGIYGARVFVLVFSEASNASSQVRREVERAAHREIPIIPFRIEDATPSDALEYFISSPHWMDAFTPPLERHIATLVDGVRRLVGTEVGSVETAATAAGPSPARRTPPVDRKGEVAVAPAPSPSAEQDAHQAMQQSLPSAAVVDRPGKPPEILFWLFLLFCGASGVGGYVVSTQPLENGLQLELTWTGIAIFFLGIALWVRWLRWIVKVTWPIVFVIAIPFLVAMGFFVASYNQP